MITELVGLQALPNPHHEGEHEVSSPASTSPDPALLCCLVEALGPLSQELQPERGLGQLFACMSSGLGH